MISRGARAERVRAAGAAQPRGRLAGIPGLAAHPSGRPALGRSPERSLGSPAHYNLQYIISPKVLTVCETPVTPELLSVISTFIHI